MYLVDIHNIIIALLLNAVHDHLDAVFEIAAILRSCQQRAHIELVDFAAFQSLRHSPFFNQPGQSPDESRLAYSRFAHMQRIVLVSAAQHLNGSLEFLLTANQRILLLVEVVHAGDEPSPGCLMLVFSCLLLQMVVVVIAADELTHKLALITAQGVLQQIAGPRLFQIEDAEDEMREV